MQSDEINNKVSSERNKRRGIIKRQNWITCKIKLHSSHS